MENRIVSDNITKLNPNEIFVFGSNLSGTQLLRNEKLM